jgi:RNA polymerase sigma-70 factor (ECF subfamily)
MGQQANIQAQTSCMNEEKQTASDMELVRRVQEGDSRSFDLLVLKYQYKVLAIVGRFMKDPFEAQDVAQETFIRAYRAIGKFRGDSAFYTWLYRIAVNTAKNYLQMRKRRPGSDVDINDDEVITDGIEGLQEVATPESQFESDELKKVVDSALMALSDELRAAITLREYDGFSYEDIADILEIPVGTVRSRIFRARELIGDRVDEFMQGNNG